MVEVEAALGGRVMVVLKDDGNSNPNSTRLQAVSFFKMGPSRGAPQENMIWMLCNRKQRYACGMPAVQS